MQPPYTNPQIPGQLTADEKNWAMACHLSAFSAYIGIPFGHILGPLLVWMLKRDTSEYINEAGKKALNFNLAMTIYLIVAGLLCFVLIGIPIVVALVIAQVILTIIASVKTSNGEVYEYPMTIKFLN